MIRIFSDKDEKELYQLVKEYTKKKPIIELRDLIDFVANRLKSNPDFNRNKIELIIKKFIKNQKILIGKKLIKEDILKIPIRNEINNLIIQNPGININQIMIYFDIGANRALWHLELLSSFKFIRSVKYEAQKNFFPYNSNPKFDVLNISLRNDKVKIILDFLKEQDQPMRPTLLSESLQMHYNTLKKYLELLVNLDLIKKINEDKQKGYVFNPNIDKNILKLVNSL